MNQKTVKTLKYISRAGIIISFLLITILALLLTFEIQYEFFRQYRFFVIALFLMLFGIIIICPLIIRFLNRREVDFRHKDFAKIAENLGWNFTENPPTPDFIIDLLGDLRTKPEEFNLLKGKTLSLATGKFEKYDAAVFEQTFNIEDDGSEINSQQTITAINFRHKELPLFVCEPSNYLGSISKTLSQNPIQIPGTPGFSMRYVVYGKDQNQVRRIFGQNVIAQLEQMLELTTIGNGNYLLCFNYGKLLSKNEIRQRLEFLTALVKNF